MRWDIFCRVVDNFGDAGVTWRLARQLADEHQATVRIFMDHLPTLARLDRRIDAQLPTQVVSGITLCHWSRDFVVDTVADVVLETFACETPSAYVEAMAALPRPPVWINLEYLSAEEWVGRCHGLPSPHPQYALTRYFFFPGFDAHSGGLLREADLLSRRDAFRASPEAQHRFWSSVGLNPPGAGTCVVSVFGYDTVQWHDLLEAWIHAARPVRCLIPEDTPLAQRAARHLERGADAPVVSRGALEAVWTPFRDQVDYDPLLWVSDFNFVRGEDSFVRAQWAGRPMAWHIYPQSGNAHQVKLQAFLDRYTQGLDSDSAPRYRRLFAAWNGEGNMAEAWNAVLPCIPKLEAHARHWAERQALLPDLTQNLVNFVKKRVE